MTKTDAREGVLSWWWDAGSLQWRVYFRRLVGAVFIAGGARAVLEAAFGRRIPEGCQVQLRESVPDFTVDDFWLDLEVSFDGICSSSV